MYRLFFWLAIVTVVAWIVFSAFVAIAMR